MRYIPLVEYAAEEVDEDGDDADDGEDCCGADALFCGLRADASVFGEDFEVVGAFVWGGADEGKGGLGSEGVFVAVEGYEG